MLFFNYETLVDPLLKEVRKFIPEFSGIKAGDKIIDVCCGTGAQVFEYGRRGVAAIGIDINPDMLKIAIKNLKKQKKANVSFQLADAANLPFPDGYFNYASISLGLHEKEKTKRYQIISEMKRVVTQDGTLIFIDYQVPLPGHAYAVFAKALEFFAGGPHYRYFKEYLASGGLQDMLTHNGLHEESRTNLMSGLLTAVKAVR